MLPLFDAELPFYVNYAKLGAIIGHEIMHECLIEQYSDYSEHSYGIIKNNTLNEDIADNGGLHFAYEAYRSELKRIDDLKQKPKLLPRLVAKNITIEQIFFLSKAQ
ncbi:hypothetical protein BLA29_013521, partial [Euroglyphus maynei]